MFCKLISISKHELLQLIAITESCTRPALVATSIRPQIRLLRRIKKQQPKLYAQVLNFECVLSYTYDYITQLGNVLKLTVGRQVQDLSLPSTAYFVIRSGDLHATVRLTPIEILTLPITL